MFRRFKRTWLILAFAGVVNSAPAMSQLGVADTWQVPRIGYMLIPNSWNLDIGTPMNLGADYRWNLRTITYGFDPTFVSYFGTNGMNEIRKMFAMLNNLPPMSKLSSDLHEIPTNTKGMNYQASALGLLDLKSEALGIMMEVLGLASSERYVWTLRARIVLPGNVIEYHIVKRNFDPLDLIPTSYVNDSLYTYAILEFANTSSGDVADAVELPVDPLAFSFTSVSSSIDSQFGGFLLAGEFFNGLTRDDIGGLRHLYSGKGPYVNYHVENLVSDALTNGVSGGAAWTPVTGSNSVLVTALRPGVDHIQFKEVKFESVLGPFISVTNIYKDTIVVNSHTRKQVYQRALTRPDILFGAQDADVGLGSRTVAFVNNAGLNGAFGNTGPGIIQPPINIVFNNTGPLFVLQTPTTLDEENATFNFVWGSFDGRTNIYVYPNGAGIQGLEQQVLGGH